MDIPTWKVDGKLRSKQDIKFATRVYKLKLIVPIVETGSHQSTNRKPLSVETLIQLVESSLSEPLKNYPQ